MKFQIRIIVPLSKDKNHSSYNCLLVDAIPVLALEVLTSACHTLGFLSVNINASVVNLHEGQSLSAFFTK